MKYMKNLQKMPVSRRRLKWDFQMQISLVTICY